MGRGGAPGRSAARLCAVEFDPGAGIEPDKKAGDRRYPLEVRQPKTIWKASHPVIIAAHCDLQPPHTVASNR